MSVIPYNKQIDGLRFFAVLGVLLCHFVHFDNQYVARLPFGQGVNLFFVLSGFLITKILMINKEAISNGEMSTSRFFLVFYIRRSLRIFPIYYLLIFYLLYIDFQNTRDVWQWLIPYASNFYAALEYPYIGSFNHLWSLAVEEQFYLIWPLMICATPKRYLLKLIVGGIVASLFFKIYYYYSFGPSAAINALPIGCADSLCFGALIAYLHLYNVPLMTRLNNSKLLIGLSLLLFTLFIVYPRPSGAVVHWGNNFLFSIFAFFVVLKVSQEKSGAIGKLFLEHKLFIQLGKISYGIYLYHFFMPDFYNQMIDWYPTVFYKEHFIYTPFLFLSSIVFAQLSWLIIEKPILLLKKRYEYKKQSSLMR